MAKSKVLRNKKYSNLTFEQKMQIISYKNKNAKVSAEIISQIFSAKFKIEVKRRTVNNLINNSEKISEIAANGNPSYKKAVTLNFPQLEKKLKCWIDEMEIKGAIVNDSLLLQKSAQFSKELGILNFKNSSGWLAKFKKRNGYQLRKLHGEMKTNESVDIQGFLDELKKKFDEYDEDNIYNLDETGLFYKLIPSKSVCKAAKPGYKNFKDRVSIMLCTNYSGSDKMKPVLIGKSVKPRCFKNFDHPSKIQYEASGRAWMTSEIFNRWLYNFDEKLRSKGKKILLLMDNCPAHSIKIELTSIEILFLPKNSTGFLQPMDLGIIRNFKLHFCQYKLSSLIIKIEGGENVYSAYEKITLKDTIIFVDLAWNDVKQTTIQNCFKHLNALKTQTEAHCIDAFYKNFIKISTIVDPIDENQFIDLQYTENEEILFETSGVKENSLQNTTEQVNVSLLNDDNDNDEILGQKKVSAESFKDALKTIDNYLNQQDEWDQIDIDFKKELLKYNRKKTAISIAEKGILAYFFKNK